VSYCVLHSTDTLAGLLARAVGFYRSHYCFEFGLRYGVRDRTGVFQYMSLFALVIVVGLALNGDYSTFVHSHIV
jgi:hypothetical protein